MDLGEGVVRGFGGERREGVCSQEPLGRVDEIRTDHARLGEEVLFSLIYFSCFFAGLF